MPTPGTSGERRKTVGFLLVVGVLTLGTLYLVPLQPEPKARLGVLLEILAMVEMVADDRTSGSDWTPPATDTPGLSYQDTPLGVVVSYTGPLQTAPLKYGDRAEACGQVAGVLSHSSILNFSMDDKRASSRTFFDSCMAGHDLDVKFLIVRPRFNTNTI